MTRRLLLANILAAGPSLPLFLQIIDTLDLVVSLKRGIPACLSAVGNKLQSSAVDNDSDPFGGNVLIEGSAELLFPLPFVKDQRQLRTGFFVDVGNVFDTSCGATQKSCHDVDFGELRYSVGVGLTWVTGFGPMSFSLAKPLNSGDYDDEEVFQFTLGRGF